MTETGPLCERLEWDSAFFGLTIARARPGGLDVSTVRAMLAWCRAHHIDCLYFLAATDDAPTRRLLEETAFTQVGERVTLSRTVDRHEGEAVSDVRPVEAADIPALRDLAGTAHRDSRFYADGRFDRDRCDELYRTWIERSCRGWAEAVLVAGPSGGPAGYVTVHVRSPREGSIGLLAVSPQHQRRGVGTALVAAALAWARERSIERLSVVTQGHNPSSMAFYQHAGFRVVDKRTWYHRWFPPEMPSTE